jgi:hypothetical protein
MLMDVVVIDAPDSWGMLLSRKWAAASLGGSLQMDLSYATIPTCEGTFVTLYREHPRRYHVEDPNEPMNEFVCTLWMMSLGTMLFFSHSLAPEIKKKKSR